MIVQLSRLLLPSLLGSIVCEAFVQPQLPTKTSQLSVSTTLSDSLLNKNDTKSEALIQKAKDIVDNKSGFYSDFDEDVFSEDFVFRGPYIGPLNKKDYFQTMESFKIHKSIPDINPNAWGFSIDPQDENRVWFMVRNSGTFTGTAFLPDSLNFEANGATLDGCPETFSVIFDEDGKMKYLSVGYVADRFEGNTDGKGAAVGIFNAIGLPFPKVGPLLRFSQWIGTEKYCVGPISYSVENVPEWWTDERVGSDGYL